MSECKYCKQEMLDSTTISCDLSILIIADQDGQILERYWRNNSYFDENERCHDCKILNMAGNYHHFGCDMERCPKCGFQLIGCDCFKGKRLQLTDSPTLGGRINAIKIPVKEKT